MSCDRIASLLNLLTDNTVLGDLVSPVSSALEYVRFKDSIFSAIGMNDFITLGVYRHIQASKSLREQVQQLMHHNDSSVPPVARSNFSDAPASKHRLNALADLQASLLKHAMRVLPDRLAMFTQLGNRPVMSIDGIYQHCFKHYTSLCPTSIRKQAGKPMMKVKVSTLSCLKHPFERLTRLETVRTVH